MIKDLKNVERRIYPVNPMLPPQYIGPDASIDNVLLNEGCTVYGEINNCVLFQGVHVGKNTKIGNNVVIDKAIIGSNVTIRRDSYIGNGNDIIVIEEGAEIKANSKILTRL
ncbi:hypothetical protein [Clostridium estertheticum]|uniref:hypothetical protein n=1 Tax=Clostridium estertheticum TaxID=238834 RepID=UPI001CF311E0|nr:hypothetical protein [Clostridium estertheticum]MCB2357933.1 hypothetical protein [Clostridium estertheticum]